MPSTLFLLFFLVVVSVSRGSDDDDDDHHQKSPATTINDDGALGAECKHTQSDSGTHWCIPTPGLSANAVLDDLHVLDYSVNGAAAAGKTVFFKLDARRYSTTRFVHGLSLFVHLNTKNAYDPELEAEQLFLLTEASRTEAILERRYLRKGVYTLQLAPSELEPLVYYFEFRNLMGRDVDFALLFQLDQPEQKFLDLPATIDARQAEGDKLLYYFVNLTQARAEQRSAAVAPRFVSARILSNVRELAQECGSEDDFVEQHQCESILMAEAVSDFWGTTFPACVAHDELRRGVSRDCWPAAVTVGRLAALSERGSLFRAYAMCPDNLCNDGCREGILQAWLVKHWDDEGVAAEAKAICKNLDDMGESCWAGLGAGLFTVQANEVVQRGQHPQTAFRNVSEECRKIAEGLDEATRTTAQEWCVEGAFRHYAGTVTANATDAEYAASFIALCQPDLLDDATLVPKCHAAQGFSAAYRARGNLGAAEETCGRLFQSAEVQSTMYGGRDDCLRAVSEYLNAEKLHKEAVATCPLDNLYSAVLYNISPRYTSPPGPGDERVVLRLLDWFNGSATWDGAVAADDDELWWFAVDSNQASTKFVVTIHSYDPAHPPTTPPPKKGDTPAAAASSPADDVAAARTNVAAVDRVTQQTTRQITGVYAGVTFAFVCLKLLLLAWLRKKLRGHSFYAVVV